MSAARIRLRETIGPLFIALSVELCLGGCQHADVPRHQSAGQFDSHGLESQEGTEPAFRTYAQAVEYVRSTYTGESINTDRSSWITGAEYFSADGRGYLILGMKGKEYIFAGVPPDVWDGFKEAPSFGKYYHAAIRGRYHFDLENSSPQLEDGQDSEDEPDRDTEEQDEQMRGR